MSSNRSTNGMTSALLVIASLVAATSWLPTHAEEYSYIPLTGDTPLFADNSPLSVTIEAPLTTLMKERPDEDYLDGTFSYTEADGNERVFNLRIRTRGKYRREKTHCDFAPIRLNFRSGQVFDSVFAGQDKLKLVTHCQNRNPHYEQLVLREYLAYRILNLLTDKSYRVRLLQINYVDTEGGRPRTKPGYVLEDDEHVAQRNGLQILKTGDISLDDVDREQHNLISVFQYMIGNTEYSLHRAEPDDDCCHNTDLMAIDQVPPYVPLAYDFDFAGLVSAPYAEPNPRYRLRTVRQRLYKGMCRNNDLLPDTVQLFLDNKDAVYELIDELELFDKKSRKHLTGYLDMFFNRISDPKSVQTRFVDRCRDKPY